MSHESAEDPLFLRLRNLDDTYGYDFTTDHESFPDPVASRDLKEDFADLIYEEMLYEQEQQRAELAHQREEQLLAQAAEARKRTFAKIGSSIFLGMTIAYDAVVLSVADIPQGQSWFLGGIGLTTLSMGFISDAWKRPA